MVGQASPVGFLRLVRGVGEMVMGLCAFFFFFFSACVLRWEIHFRKEQLTPRGYIYLGQTRQIANRASQSVPSL